jgi:hypothetical protein
MKLKSNGGGNGEKQAFENESMVISMAAAKMSAK